MRTEKPSVRETGTNENQYVTSPRGENLGRNVNVRRCECIRNYPQGYNPVLGAAREWNNNAVASIVYMIQDRDFDRNVDTDDILSLLGEQDTEDFMDTPSTFHTKESFDIKNQSHDPDTPTYMEALLGENLEEYYKVMVDEIKRLMRRDTWEIVLSKSVNQVQEET